LIVLGCQKDDNPTYKTFCPDEETAGSVTRVSVGLYRLVLFFVSWKCLYRLQNLARDCLALRKIVGSAWCIDV
jgi:hypothetical protein